MAAAIPGNSIKILGKAKELTSGATAGIAVSNQDYKETLVAVLVVQDTKS